jgi:hypothetical protein
MTHSPLRNASWILAGALVACAATASPADAGSSTFQPIADAHVASDAPASNFAAASRMGVDGSPVAQTFLRFQVSGLTGTVSTARLRLFANNPTTDGPQLQRSVGTWTEAGLTWNNRPSPSGAALGDLGAVNTDSWVELDVTAAVTGNGTYDFALSAGSSDGSTYHSREAANPPQLVVTTSAAPAPTPTPTPTPTTSTVDVTLTPTSGVTGTQRVNFAVPFARGRLLDPARIRVFSGSTELSAARRVLALHPDNSVRSVQIQVDIAAVAGTTLQVRAGETPTKPPLAIVDVSTTLVAADGTLGPRVWARLPASWLSASGITGPQIAESQTTGTAATAWRNVCDYTNHAVSAFLSVSSTKDAWLYDRGTAMYRGYARRGDFVTLESAYRETAMYRKGMTGTGTSTRIGVPGAVDDLKYHYNQNLAIHYLLTGDNRFRESAESLAQRVAALWGSPDYAGGSDFWTERHAGFALLAYVWADIVTDDHGTEFQELADDAVDAYLAMQSRFPSGWTDTAARCFAHSAEAHGESFGTVGCSPWMSAILADGLDAYAIERGGSDAQAARGAIVKLGKILARDGRDARGKPLYWLGVGTATDEVDPFEEHWGEAAYVVAMAWHAGGRSDATLLNAANALLGGLASNGTSPHLRSFNWQCRSAVATPFYLQ